MKLKEFIGRYLTVHKCAGCRDILEYEDHDSAFCLECKLSWNAAKTETCPACNQSAVECICMPRGLKGSGALCLRKLIFYSAKKNGEPQNRAIFFLKKNKNRRVAAFFAGELKRAALSEIGIFTSDAARDAVIVNVPRGVKARAAHGFDQSELVCRELSFITGIPYLPALKRRRGGKEQKKLDKGKRFRNVSSLFKLRCEDDVKDKYVLLFDDVVTTGASLAACASRLRKAGAKGRICLTVAQD